MIIWRIHFREYEQHGLINYTDTKAKCRHLKKLTCKETLRQVFIDLKSSCLRVFVWGGVANL